MSDGDEGDEGLQRSVFYWADFKEQADAKNAKNHAKITAKEVAVKHGVPESQFHAYLSNEIEAAESCSSLPFTLLLVFSYAAMAILHDQAPLVNAVEDSISFDIVENANFAFSSDFMGHKGMDDVNSHADFWSWMSRGFVPLIFQQTYQVGESRDLASQDVMDITEEFPRSERGVLLNYNRIVLGVRLRQEVYGANLDDVPCAGGTTADQLEAVYNRECVGGSESTDYRLQPEEFNARLTTDPVKEEWLYIHDDLAVIRRKLDDMERTGWLDLHTRKVEIALPIYNAEYGIHCLFYCNYFFSRGGHIWKDIISMNTFDFWYKYWYNFVCDGTWLCCLIYIIVTEGREVVAVVKEHGVMGIKKNYMSFWNAVDWISVFTGLALIAMAYINAAQTGVMNARLQELGLVNEMDAQDRYRQKGIEYIDALEMEVHFYYWVKMAFAGYPMIIVLRLFKAFGAQPRLALVSNTLKKAWIDLIHFLLIFVSIFATFTVAAVVLMGREVKSFTTPFRSVVSCFRSMLGDFDWNDMARVGRVDAFVFWFFPFIVLIVMVLLNMLIAIVMDAYAEVVSGISSADTLWSQGKKVWERLRNRDGAVDLRLIHAGLIRKQKEEAKEHAMDGDDGMETLEEVSIPANKVEDEKEKIITVSELKGVFKEMKTGQAKQLVTAAVLMYYNQHKESANIDEVVQLIRKIDHRTKKLKNLDKQRLDAVGQARNDPAQVASLSRECYEELVAAREDLTEWLPEDPSDVPLPKEFLKTPVEEEDKARLAPLALTSSGDPADPRGSHLSELLPMYSVGRRKAPEITVGGTAEILSDEHMVIDACRRAGIDPQNDDLRRAAVGRSVKVLERDDRDGTVRCHVPGVGLVWFAIHAFASKTKDEGRELGEGSTTVSDNSGGVGVERIQELERELDVGRDTVAEAIKAVNELHARLIRTKEDKRRNIAKFHELRKKAVLMSKENRSQKTKFAQDNATLKRTTIERDKLFDQVKQLVEENRELETKIGLNRR